MRSTAAGRAGHVAALDGLRGLAALVVVIRHSFNSVVMPHSVREVVLQSPLALFLNGQGAVQLFFVLSGYVLASSLSRSREWIDLGQYVVKRVFRIHPPYVFAVLFAWTASFFYPQLSPDSGLMPSIRNLAAVHIDVSALLDSLRFPGPAHSQLPVGWTLRIEMIFSLLLPILFLVARRTHWLLLLAASSYWLANPDRTLVYMLDFSLGIAIFLERGRLLSFLRGAGAPARTAGVLGALFLFHAPLLLGWSVRFNGILVSGFRPSEIAVMGVGAAGLVIACLGVPWVEATLSSRPCRYLGRISYSLYLVHGPVLVLCTFLLAGAPSPGAGVAFFFSVVAASIAVSDLSYRWIERPSIAAGNRICRWLARRTGTKAVPSELVPPRS
jgi:peptidoglycan/LPS O-acetylase OafA/YrhL